MWKYANYGIRGILWTGCLDMDGVYRRWAIQLAALTGGSEEDREVYLYSLRVWGSTLITTLVMAAVAWLTDSLSLTFASAISAALLRIFAGGAHQHKAEVCTLISVGVHLSIAWIVKYDLLFSLSMAWYAWLAAIAFVGWAVVTYAPAAAVTKPIEGDERIKFRRLSFISFGVVASMLALMIIGQWPAGAIAGCLGLAWQGFTMTKAGFQFAHQVDQWLEKAYTRASTPGVE